MTEDRGKVIAKKGTSEMYQQIKSLRVRIKVLEKASIALEQDYEKLLNATLKENT